LRNDNTLVNKIVISLYY